MCYIIMMQLFYGGYVLKIIIAGIGKIGDTLTRQLSAEGYDITIIDTNKKVLDEKIDHYDVMAYQGNCALGKTLRSAGAAGADLLIASTGNDEINLLCCITARSINPEIHTIARLRNSEYTEQVYSMRDIFDIPLIFNPEKQAAIEIERLIRYPGFLKRDTFTKGRVEIVELKIENGSKLCRAQLNDITKIVRCAVLVCAVLRDGKAITPDGSFVIEAGDRIFVTASAENLSSMLRQLGFVNHKAKNVIIAGAGTLSQYLAALLLRRHIGVKVIEKNPEAALRMSEKLPDAEVIVADAGVPALLESEGISTCDAIVTLTGLDELNIIISLYGSSAGVPQIITKLGRMDETEIIERLSIGNIISPRLLACRNVVQYVKALNNQKGGALSLHMIADGKAQALEFVADKKTLHCREQLKTIKTKKDVLIACITRNGEPMIPNGTSFFEEGDTLIVVAVGDTPILQLNDIFE